MKRRSFINAAQNRGSGEKNRKSVPMKGILKKPSNRGLHFSNDIVDEDGSARSGGAKSRGAESKRTASIQEHSSGESSSGLSNN